MGEAVLGAVDHRMEQEALRVEDVEPSAPASGRAPPSISVSGSPQ